MLLFLGSPGLETGLLPFPISPLNVCTYIYHYPVHCTRPTHLIFANVVILVICYEGY